MAKLNLNLIPANTVKPTTLTVTVTPDMAAEWLEVNTANRPVKQHVVAQYAAAMKRGEWKLTHQGIAFDKYGKLQDGQHRLWAIIDSGVSVEMQVTRNASPEAFTCLDNGAKRTLADLTQLPNAHAQVCAALARIAGGSSAASAASVEKYYAAFGDSIKALLSYHGGAARTFSAAPIKAMAVLRTTLDPSSTDYVCQVYAGMCGMKLENLPSVAASFVRSAMRDRITTANSTDVACRAWRVVDPKNSHLSIVKILDQDKTLAEIKDAINRVVKKSGAQ
jgi:predicted transglutaminase-like cysteine proteinase